MRRYENREHQKTEGREHFSKVFRPRAGPALLHAGRDRAVEMKDVVAILQKATIDASRDTRDLIEIAASEGSLVDLSAGKCEAVIFTTDEVVLCPVTTPTLKRRAEGRG